MGNFSRNTYAPLKNYVGVRLQQGVPLVDADWNELNDVLLQETYRAAAEGIGTGVRPSNTFFAPLSPYLPGGMNNDFWLIGGTLMLAGQPVVIGTVQYANQPYANAAAAAAAGVPVVLPLTTPGAARTDTVYLDVWTREVSSTEDTNLVNPVIGVETAVRIKRDYAVRVAEGSLLVPPAPAGHTHFGVAYLNRTTNAATILQTMVVDLKPTLLGASGPRRLAVFPSFQNTALSSGAGWQIGFPLVPKFYAFKNAPDAAFGCVPIHLPEGSRITSIRYRGRMDGSLSFQLMRIATRPTTALFGGDAVVTADDYLTISTTTLSPPTIGTLSAYDQFANIAPFSDGRHITRNVEHFLLLMASASNGVTAYVTGITILYEV